MFVGTVKPIERLWRVMPVAVRCSFWLAMVLANALGSSDPQWLSLLLSDTGVAGNLRSEDSESDNVEELQRDIARHPARQRHPSLHVAVHQHPGHQVASPTRDRPRCDVSIIPAQAELHPPLRC